MAGLIGAGKGLRQQANLGMSKVSSADYAEEGRRLQMEQAEAAQKSATVGTAGGIGGSVGINKALALTETAKDAKLAMETAATANEAAQLVATTNATVESTAAAAKTAEALKVATTTSEVAATGASTLAQVGAIAGPVAIALGIGYLFSELF